MGAKQYRSKVVDDSGANFQNDVLTNLQKGGPTLRYPNGIVITNGPQPASAKQGQGVLYRKSSQFLQEGRKGGGKAPGGGPPAMGVQGSKLADHQSLIN